MVFAIYLSTYFCLRVYLTGNTRSGGKPSLWIEPIVRMRRHKGEHNRYMAHTYLDD